MRLKETLWASLVPLVGAGLLGCAATGRTGSGEPPRALAFDFESAFADPETINPNNAGIESRTVEGRTRIGLFQHPAGVGEPLAAVTFPGVELPAVGGDERLLFESHLAIASGFSKAENPVADGVAFIVEVDGETVLDLPYEEQRWRHVTVDLGAYAGRVVDVTFKTDPLENSAYDWAIWGAPRLVIEGREGAAANGGGVAALFPVEVLDGKLPPAAPRIVRGDAGPGGGLVVAVQDPYLDLGAQLALHAGDANDRVPFAPPMVVGQGPHHENHTFVKVLDRFGMPVVQFLAYPPEVRGGVAVGAGDHFIAAAPLLDPAVDEIRLFSHDGVRRGSFVPSEAGSPPYEIAVDDFIRNNPGHEIRVRGSNGVSEFYYNGRGTLVGRMARTAPEAGTASAFGGVLVPVEDHGGKSLLRRINPDGSEEVIDAGAHENKFFVQWNGREDGRGDWTYDGAEYIKESLYRHVRTDGGPAYKYTSPRADGTFDPDVDLARLLDDYRFEDGFMNFDNPLPAIWNVCFTHRAFYDLFKPWTLITDEDTGLPVYPMLSRNNRVSTYGEFGTTGFIQSTYAPGLPMMDRHYTGTLRVMLQEFATHVRRRPEHFVALEPNHEHEIAVAEDGSLGDYNPRMIAGFLRHLRQNYGPDLGHINKIMGTPFADGFDAPRMKERGAWDIYDQSNPFFANWIEYQRYTVNRRIADGFREALLAGFPPESIKSHQIPDAYALGDLGSFSDVLSRYTPIDYAIDAGVGFGFTRYSVWYKRPNNILQGTFTSGFDSSVTGEYQALTPDYGEAYNQLKKLFDHGVMSVHCMRWPADFDNGYNATMDAAIGRLIAESDVPRPRQTGGVGMVRPYDDGARQFDIVVVGEGDGHRGLLKSIRADGSWEGSVYAVPFRTRIAVTELARADRKTIRQGGHAAIALPEADSGMQFEVEFAASAQSGNAGVRFAVRNRGAELPGLARSIPLDAEPSYYRIIFRTQTPVDGLEIELRADGGDIVLEEFLATHQVDQNINVRTGVFEGEPHRGGIVFDLLPVAE